MKTVKILKPEGYRITPIAIRTEEAMPPIQIFDSQWAFDRKSATKKRFMFWRHRAKSARDPSSGFVIAWRVNFSSLSEMHAKNQTSPGKIQQGKSYWATLQYLLGNASIVGRALDGTLRFRRWKRSRALSRRCHRSLAACQAMNGDAVKARPGREKTKGRYRPGLY